jgi:hypothetical protein
MDDPVDTAMWMIMPAVWGWGQSTGKDWTLFRGAKGVYITDHEHCRLLVDILEVRDDTFLELVPGRIRAIRDGDWPGVGKT